MNDDQEKRAAEKEVSSAEEAANIGCAKIGCLLPLGLFGSCVVIALVVGGGEDSGSNGNADGTAADCMSPWSGNHRDFEAQVKRMLRDPESMEVIRTMGNGDAKGPSVPISMQYRARNGFGGMNVAAASGRLNTTTCQVTITDYGF